MRFVFIESECICSLVQVLLHGRGLHSILPCPSAKALVAFCWLFQKLPMPPKRNTASLADLQANCARIDQDIASLRTELRNRRRREAYTHQIPKMVDTAARVLWCRHHKLDHLMKFLRFKTGADTTDLKGGRLLCLRGSHRPLQSSVRIWLMPSRMHRCEEQLLKLRSTARSRPCTSGWSA